MRARLMIGILGAALAGSVAFGQIGRTGSQWQTPLGDAQRTSALRTDDRISVDAVSKGGFELQWKVKLDNPPRGIYGLRQGVTATGITIFVPMSIVAGSSNTVYGVDNDLGYVVWKKQFDAALPAPSARCPGGISAGATRIVPLTEPAAQRSAFDTGRGAVGYRSLLGQPGQGVPVEGRGGPPQRTEPPADAKQPAAARDAAQAAKPAEPQQPPPPAPRVRTDEDANRIPGAPRRQAMTEQEKMAEAYGYGFLFRPSGVVYVISSDGMLHVLGLPSGKDMQRPARFLPANAKWSSPIAIGTTLYASTSGGCGDAPDAIWAIDLDSDDKPVVSWRTDGGPVAGAVAFTSDGTLIAAIGAGQVTGSGKATAIVALDAKTLKVKDWFSQPSAEFVTGPSILRHNDKEIVAAATKDGRVWLLDAKSLGGADHATPLHVSQSVLGSGATIAADALAAWRPAAADAASWILVPVSGRLASGLPSTNGAITTGAVVAMKVSDTGGTLALAPGWVSQNLNAPATPLVVNGVAFTLATGVPDGASGQGTAAVLHAYDGATGARVWTSGKAMTTPASPGSLWVGYGQVYVGASDGTLHAFGLNDERRPTNDR